MIVLGGSKFTRCIPLSKREAKIKIRPDFCVRQVYFTSKSWRQIWWRVNQPFKHTFFSSISRTIEARASDAQQISIDHIIKRFHEENSIIPGLFS